MGGLYIGEMRGWGGVEKLVNVGGQNIGAKFCSLETATFYWR